VAKKTPRQSFGEKVVDETIMLKRPRRGARLREEVWQTRSGRVTKYNLAYIHHGVCQVDNGRVLGYDNSHDHHHHHRHFMGNVEATGFKDYESQAARFWEEVQKLWRKEDEENG
jgi:Family of unknown function (DUF6516)